MILLIVPGISLSLSACLLLDRYQTGSIDFCRRRCRVWVFLNIYESSPPLASPFSRWWFSVFILRNPIFMYTIPGPKRGACIWLQGNHKLRIICWSLLQSLFSHPTFTTSYTHHIVQGTCVPFAERSVLIPNESEGVGLVWSGLVGTLQHEPSPGPGPKVKRMSWFYELAEGFHVEFPEWRFAILHRIRIWEAGERRSFGVLKELVIINRLVFWLRFIFIAATCKLRGKVVSGISILPSIQGGCKT